MALRVLGSGIQYAFEDSTGLLHVVQAGPGGVTDLGVLNGLPAILAAINALASSLGYGVVAKTNGATLALLANNVVGGASAVVNLPVLLAGNVGQRLTVTFGGTVAVTISAGAGVTVSDSSAGGTLADTTVGEAGWANVTLQAVSTTQWVIVGGDGTWTTT